MKKALPQLPEPGQKSDEKFVFIVEDRRFPIDKQLLLSNTYFQSLMMGSQRNEFVLNDVSSAAFEIILQHIETDYIPHDLDNDLLVDVIGPSRRMLDYELHDVCCKRVQITETSYEKVCSLSNKYSNDILKEKIAEFQARNFRRMKEDLLILASDRIEFLLSNATIDAPADEIVDFLLEWSKINENALHLPRLFSLVNMSSLTEKKLHYYLNKEPIITTNKDICNAFLKSTLGYV